MVKLLIMSNFTFDTLFSIVIAAEASESATCDKGLKMFLVVFLRRCFQLRLLQIVQHVCRKGLTLLDIEMSRCFLYRCLSGSILVVISVIEYIRLRNVRTATRYKGNIWRAKKKCMGTFVSWFCKLKAYCNSLHFIEALEA